MSYPLVMQEMELWCWSAVSVSVDRFRDQTSTRRQCDVASLVLAPVRCCGNEENCNSAQSLADALNSIGRLEAALEYPVSFDDVQAQLQAQFPVGVRIAWFGGSAHFAAISGAFYSGGHQRLVIEDPLYGQSIVRYDRFPTEYVGGGNWTHTYLTR